MSIFPYNYSQESIFILFILSATKALEAVLDVSMENRLQKWCRPSNIFLCKTSFISSPLRLSNLTLHTHLRNIKTKIYRVKPHKNFNVLTLETSQTDTEVRNHIQKIGLTNKPLHIVYQLLKVCSQNCWIFLKIH